MKLSEFRRDSEREEQGEWVDLPSWPGISVLVRSQQVPDFRNAFNAKMGKLRRRYGDQPVPVETSERITGEAIADYLWLDVSGLEDDQGNPLKLDQDTKRDIMTNREYRDLADAVTWATNQVGEIEADRLEDDRGNSGPSTSGKPSSGTGSKGSAKTAKSGAGESPN